MLLFTASIPGFANVPSAPVEAVLEVSSSAAPTGDTLVVLRGSDGTLYLEEADFGKLRLHLPQTAPYERGGHRYYAPSALKGCTVTIDEARQRAVISVPVWDLDSTHLSANERQHPAVTPASPGAFFNYQLSAQQVDGVTTGGIYSEIGMFAGAGVLTSSSVARVEGGEDSYIRLDTTFTHDFPDRLETLNVGDTISDPGSWGDAVRYAGLRWSRNFALRPDLLTTPLLATSGTATVPSTVDVFVNNQLVTSSQVPAGPFVIDRLPTVTGSGEVNVVVRDALGREQVMSQYFYTSSALLARDLTQYAVNFGSVRDDYASSSDRYGGMLEEASYRRGITDDFTLEGHGEYLSGDSHAAGLNAVYGLGTVGTVNITAANGGTASGSGWLTGAGMEHHGLNWSVLADTTWAGSKFAQVGEPADPAMRIRRRTVLQSSAGLGRYGSLSLAYVIQNYRSSPAQRTASVTHTLSLGRAGALNLTVSRIGTAAAVAAPGQASSSVYLNYVYALGERRTASVTAVAGSGDGAPDSAIIASVAESPPMGPGGGYRLSASTLGDYDADWHQQTGAADVEVEAARNAGITGQSALVTGALTWLDGHINASRSSVNGSFAVVDVGGIADVPVYVENQVMTHTDASGKALLYNLRPYEANRISIAPEDLPLDTAIAASSTVVAPPYRSGVVVSFPVQRVKGATFRLVTRDGKPVPTGATVNLAGDEFPVVRDGMVYVTGYEPGLAAEAAWSGGRCVFRLGVATPGVITLPRDEPIPDLGVIRCQ